MILLPLVDLLNHAAADSHEANCKKEYNAMGDIIVLTTRRVESGEELCHCYSETEKPATMHAKYEISPDQSHHTTEVEK